MEKYNQLIREKRAKHMEYRSDISPSRFTYTTTNINNNKIKRLTDISWYSTKVGEITYCDTKQFLFQDVYKHTFILSKRGIGKTYSLYEYIIDTTVDFIKKDLAYAVDNSDKSDIQLPLMVAFILQNAYYTGPLVKTLNEMLLKHQLGDYINIEVVPYLYDKLAIEVVIDLGGVMKFKKCYIFAETFKLTQPNLARGRQFIEFQYVVFDEFEKAFAKSLLDEDRVMVDVDKLFDNFKDLLNSFQRNKNLRYLYMGNITNLNSIIWDFLKIVNFDFTTQINDHEESKDKILILNLIPLFTNESMANYFQDLTTLGISEEELFKMDGIINEDNSIVNLSMNAFVLFDDDYIYYFDNGICNIESVNMQSMQKLNEVLDIEFEVKHTVVKSDYELMDEYLLKHGIEHNEYTESIVPLQDLHSGYETIDIIKIPVYCIGKMSLDNTIAVEDRMSLLKSFSKTKYKFRSHREYFIYTNLIGY